MEVVEANLVERNIELSSEFSRYVLEHPEIEDKLSSAEEIVFIPEYDTELKEYNLTLARELEKAGTKVLYVRIGRLKPKILSRIEGVELEMHACG
ncbi:MAG: DUF5647 family protein [Desulfoferrobacter sp.]